MRSDNVKTAEGLGGTNIQGADDPKTRIDAAHSNVAEPKPSDPEWVNRQGRKSHTQHPAQQLDTLTRACTQKCYDF
jgi:hypothetical protein